MSDGLRKAKTSPSLYIASRSLQRAHTAASAMISTRRRRISAISGVHYQILVLIDGSKEGWRALNAVMYFFDRAKDILNAVTIKDSNTPKDIEAEITRVVKKTYPHLRPHQLRTMVLDKNDVPGRDRILDLVGKENYDLLALGMQGRKNNDMNPLRIFGDINDLSVRASKCTTLIAPSCAELPGEDESGIFVVVIDGSMNSKHAYETARAWMKEGDYLYVIKVGDPRGDEPNTPTKLRSSFLGKQYASKLSDLENASFELLTGKKLAPEIIEFCRQKNAHFLFHGADEMQTWANKGDVIGSVSDALVRESECFLIISRLNILQQ